MVQLPRKYKHYPTYDMSDSEDSDSSSGSSFCTSESDDTRSLASGEILDGLVQEEVIVEQDNLPNAENPNPNPGEDDILVDIVQPEHNPLPDADLQLWDLFNDNPVNDLDDISVSSLSDSSLTSDSSHHDNPEASEDDSEGADSTPPSSPSISPRYEPVELQPITPREGASAFQRPQTRGEGLNNTSDPDLDVLSLSCSSLSSMSSYVASDESDTPRDLKK